MGFRGFRERLSPGGVMPGLIGFYFAEPFFFAGFFGASARASEIVMPFTRFSFVRNEKSHLIPVASPLSQETLPLIPDTSP